MNKLHITVGDIRKSGGNYYNPDTCALARVAQRTFNDVNMRGGCFSMSKKLGYDI